MATYNGTVINGALNLRKSASKGSTSLASIPNGTSIVVSEYQGDSGWYCTTYNEKSGFVMKSYVKLGTKLPYKSATVTGGGLNLRLYPSTSAHSPVQIPNGTKLNVQAHNKTWSSVTYNENSGFVMTKFLNIGGSSGGGDTGGGSPAGSFILGTKFDGTSSSLITGSFNIREEPSTSSKLVAEDDSQGLLFSQYYTFSGTRWSTTQKNEWLYRKPDTGGGYEGYVMAKLIGTGGDSKANASISGSGVNFRTSPNTSASVITTLSINQRVQILDSISGWYRVTCMKGTGWVSSSYVKED